MINIPFITALKAHREAFSISHKESIEKLSKSAYEPKKHQIDKMDIDSDNLEFLDKCIEFIEIGEKESTLNGYLKVLEKENELYLSELVEKVKMIIELKKMVKKAFEYVPQEKKKEISDIWTFKK